VVFTAGVSPRKEAVVLAAGVAKLWVVLAAGVLNEAVVLAAGVFMESCLRDMALAAAMRVNFIC